MEQGLGLKKKSFAAGGADRETHSAAVKSAIAKGLYILGSIARAAIVTAASVLRPVLSFLGIGIIVLLALTWIASVAGVVFGFPFFNFLLPKAPFLTALGITNFLLVIGLPVVGLSFVILRLLFRTRVHKYWIAGLSTLWAINFFSLVTLGFKIGEQFQTEARTPVGSTREIQADTLTVNVADNPYQNRLLRIDELGIVDGKLLNENVKLNIEKASGSNFVITQEHLSRGESQVEATQLATQIEYPITAEGNALTLPPYYFLPKGGKWRNQQVIVTIRVPEGKYIALGDHTVHLVHDVIISERSETQWPESNQIWQMTTDGLLLGERKSGEDNSFGAATQELSNAQFSGIRIEGPLKITIEQNDEYQVRLMGDDALKNQVKISQDGSILSVRTEFEDLNEPMRLLIQVPTLSSLELRNTDDVKISGFDLKALQLTADGQQSIKAYLDAFDLTVNLSGETELQLKGNGQTFVANLDGTASLDAGYFEASVADVKAPAGEHKIELAVKDTLRQSISEDVNLKVKGNPLTIKKN